MNDKMKLELSSDYGKVIKSYALDKETVEAIDRASSDLGIKSRSETLREIVKRYDKWQETHDMQS